MAAGHTRLAGCQSTPDWLAVSSHQTGWLSVHTRLAGCQSTPDWLSVHTRLAVSPHQTGWLSVYTRLAACQCTPDWLAVSLHQTGWLSVPLACTSCCMPAAIVRMTCTGVASSAMATTQLHTDHRHSATHCTAHYMEDIVVDILSQYRNV